MGTNRVSVHNIAVVDINPEAGLLYLKGAIPGARGSVVMVKGLGEMKIEKKEEPKAEVVEEVKNEEPKAEAVEEPKVEEKKEEETKVVEEAKSEVVVEETKEESKS